MRATSTGHGPRITDHVHSNLKPVRLVPGLVESPCQIIIGFMEMINDEVQESPDDFGIEIFHPAGNGGIEEYVFIVPHGVFHDGMLRIQLIDVIHEGLPGRSPGHGAQMGADQGVHGIIRNDRHHQFMLRAGRNGRHENHGIKRIVGIPAAEEIEIMVFHVFFENVSFLIFSWCILGKLGDGSHLEPFCKSAVQNRYVFIIQNLME